ncbi:NACHT domain-containing protein [Nonomuraea zeae]|uniref:NACHT domain-containing protein n=1 Tax=Nonomuraea zeae TaxID=1642303 RepID=A0A5S4G176_9ACTN|nr:NACHT domain-containing protein [Nonomuraea zeae]TMR26689.1 NACHT domain-containing protein [Nonomuraea zeae]
MRPSRLAALGLTALGLTFAILAAVEQWLSEGMLSWEYPAAALSLGVFALVIQVTSRDSISMPPDERRVEAERLLPDLVRQQWRWEASARGLFDPEPMPLRWRAGGLPEDDVATLVSGFRARPTRRMLILGEPGSGKTTLSLLILLQLLDQRTEHDPIPVLFSLSSWDPAREPFHDWLAARLLTDYPALSVAGPETGRALVAQRRVLPILDGLDEVPAERQARMIGALETTLPPGDPVIITSRVAEFRALNADQRLGIRLNGLEVELLPVSPADYLPWLADLLPASPGEGWTTLLAALRADPTGPVAETLSRPWALALLRSTYAAGGDPAELLDRARFPDTDAVESHLIDRLMSTAELAEPRFSSGDIRRWLTFLAEHMTGDLAWWQLPRAVSPFLHYALGALACSGLTLFVTGAIGVSGAPLGAVPFLIAGAAGVAGAGYAAFGRRRSLSWRPRSGAGFATSPAETLRAALVTALVQAGTAALVVGLGVEVFRHLRAEFGTGLASSLATGSVAGLIVALTTPGVTYLLTVAVLAARGLLPLRLMSFLDHAAAIGLLQQVGPAYRFRHLSPEDLLAGPRRLEEYDEYAGEEDPFESLPHSPVSTPGTEQAPVTVPVAPPQPQVVAIPSTSAIDKVAEEKIYEATLVLAEVLLKIDESRHDRSREAVKRLIQRLLAANADAVERAAAAQFERYRNARERLVEAARLSFWSRPAPQYRVAAWLAGGVAVWTAGMWWLPVGTFRLLLAVALAACAVVPMARVAVARVRWKRWDATYGGALRRALISPPPPLLVGGLAASFLLEPPGFPHEPPGFPLVPPGFPGPAGTGAEPPVLLWAACAAWLVATLLWLSSAPSFQIRTILAARDPAEWLQLPAGLAGYRVAAEQAHRDWIGAMVREGVLPLLRAELSDEHDAMTTVLPAVDPGRLGGLSRIEEFVATEEAAYLTQLITKLGSASIGLSGSRGAGKSTVLRHLCGREGDRSSAHLCLLVHAPTAYNAKEFITHLFLKVCEEVTGDTGPQASALRRRRRLVRMLPAVTALAGTVLMAGALQWDRLRPMMTEATSRPAVLVAALGAVLIVGGLLAAWRASLRRPLVMGSSASEVAAREHLRSLRYLQAETRTRSGELALPGGVKMARQAAVQRTEQARSHPHLVADLQDLLGKIALDRQGLQGKVIIGIDELDKIGTAEDAERFLNDLKVIFGVHGCFFLVALSEDALTGFERRSLAIRNTFDSAFDRIIRIPPLRSAESRTLLTRRGVPLPIPYVWLCHALTGGLPRDLLRTALDLTTMAGKHDEHDLAPLAARLIRQDLGTVIGAQLRVAAQLPGDRAPAVTEWLAKCGAAAPLTVAALDGLADAAPPEAAGEPVVVQARAHLFILAALTRIFIESPQTSLASLHAEPAVIDRIAGTRLLLATDPHLAWHTIRRIREEAAFLSPVG